MDNPAVFAFIIATLAMILLSANLLFLRSVQHQTYLPLAVFLVAIGITISRIAIIGFSPQLQIILTTLSLPALLLLGPSLWLYVQGITSETPWCFEKKHSRHLIPFFLGGVVVFVFFSLPYEIQEALIVRGDEEGVNLGSELDRNMAIFAMAGALFLILSWIIQSGIYFLMIISRLSRYRLRLKDLFASNESKEIKWLSWLLFAVGAAWLVIVLTLLSDNIFSFIDISNTTISASIFLMIWSLCIWGLRQKPGFEELYKDSTTMAETVEAHDKGDKKYQKSALDEEQSAKIAKKIEKAMTVDTLYLDASLSLQKLAKHIAVSPNYISQTLNETIGMNFFDLVNKYRVEAAKSLLIQSNETVLDIAMNVGFNAKSSFYTAFKKETQQTPSSFRKVNINNLSSG